MNVMRILIGCALAMAGSTISFAEEDLSMTGKGDRVMGASWATRSPVIAMNGMAATSQPLASQIAIDILKAGGSAVDAAIAANAALGLMEPTGSGIGGDLFAIVWDPKTQALHGLNASGRSPLSLDLATMRGLVGDGGIIPSHGPLPVSVPGAVDGWFELHGKFGHLPMADILAPAIRYAREGFPVSQVIAAAMQGSQPGFERRADMIGELDNYRSTYLIDGKSPVEGQIFKNPDLANTYEMIAEGGRDAYYKGPIADVIDAYMKRVGGYITKEDLAAHHSDWVTPSHVTYRGYALHELPPNGQGIAALQMLNILEGFDVAAMGHNSADYLHLQVEAKKIAYADRARFYADMDVYDVPLAGLLSKEYGTKRAALIDMKKAAQAVDHGDEKLLRGDTIYLSVADKDGMMVSLIQSNYRGMGTGLVPDGLGFMFQDRGELFTLEDGHPNQYAPGKRPFHTIIPAFITKDGKPFMAFGVMGGGMQPQGHVQILMNMVDFGMTVQDAGDAARYHHWGSSEPTGEVMTDGGTVDVESGVDPRVIADLESRGHKVQVTSGPFGGYQAIMRHPETGAYWGASEMRKDGQAIGY